MKTTERLPLPEAILRAAMPAFIDGGYDNTSMDEIAARAGTTKRTVYAHFGSKEQLFRAAIGKGVEYFHGTLPPLGTERPPAEELGAFAARLCELCTLERAVRLQRVAMAEAERFPDLGQLLHRDVIEGTERRVADYLLALAVSRQLGRQKPSPEWAMAMASMFVNVTTGTQRFAALLQSRELLPGPPGPEISPEVDRDQINRAVHLFLAGFYAELAGDFR